MSSELAAFIDHARQKGLDHSTIRMLLLSAGWKEKEIARALTEQSLDMPVPIPPDTGGAREAFFHLLTFAAFYTVIIAGIQLLFGYINLGFADPALTEPYVREEVQLEAVRGGLAALIVAFPALLWFSRFLQREMGAHPDKARSGVRRWLTYLTLFVAAVALGGDVISLVYNLLRGELSGRFLMKFLTVLVIAGLSFAYFLLSLRMDPGKPATSRMHRSFAGIAGALVLFTVAWGLVIAGSPRTQRLHMFDTRRLDHLQTISTEISRICLGPESERKREEKSLRRAVPATLDEVVKEAKGRKPRILDPETNVPYAYEVLGESKFRLCATFSFPRDEDVEAFWNHQQGRHCFEFDVLKPD